MKLLMGDARRGRALAAILVAGLLAACSFASRRAGVENVWRESGRLDGIEIGTSRVGDVLGRLGPPSQMVEIGDRTLLYYLLEQSETSTLFLVVYNQADTRVAYDRAVFLFDVGGVLTQMSFSDEIAAAPEGDDS